MASPYTSVAVTGYNANPPADDGSATAANTIYWATIKTKLNDTLKTAIEAINTNNIAAFAKVIGGGGVSSTAVDATVQSTDQGKLIRATAASVTITTPDATAVLSPFVFAVLNNSSGTITLDGNGTQTIDGNLTVTLPAGGGTLLFTDGTNWFTTGIQGTFVGKQLSAGSVLNATIAESNATNAVTFALKTLAGNDPSANDPVVLCYRNATNATGNYVYRTQTAALSLVISSGSTLGFASGVAGKLWIVIFDDAGTNRLGVMNCLSGTNIYPLGQNPIASSTAEGGAGAADSAQVFYTGTAVTNKAYIILGHATYESGIATAGSWNASPTKIRLFSAGVPLPGATVQSQRSATGASTTGTTVIPADDTIPQNTEGDQYMSQAITPTSAANVLRVTSKALLANSAAGGVASLIGLALFQDSTANALVFSGASHTSSNLATWHAIDYEMASGTTSATTFKIRGGCSAVGTTTFNGASGARLYGGVANSHLSITELVA